MLDNDSRNRMGMLKPTKGTECPSGADGMALCQTVLSTIFWDFTLEYWDGCCIEDRGRMPFGCGSVAPTTAWDLVRLRSSTQKGKDVETDLLFCWGANDARLHVLISSHYIYLSDPGNSILGACFLGFLAKRFTYFWSANLSLIQHK